MMRAPCTGHGLRRHTARTLRATRLLDQPSPSSFSPRPAAAATVLWDLDNVRPPAGADPASLLQAVAGGRDGAASPPCPPSITLFANAATAASLPRGWDPPPPGATLVTLPSTPGAVDQAITAAVVDFVTASSNRPPSSTSPPFLTLVSSDARAFTSLLRWASSKKCRTRVIGSFPGARPGRPDAWRSRPLPAAAHEAVLWEVLSVPAAPTASAPAPARGD
jgi:hypothetical protein